MERDKNVDITPLSYVSRAEARLGLLILDIWSHFLCVILLDIICDLFFVKEVLFVV